MACFPSLQLLVACCPAPSVAPPELHGCPAAALPLVACCGEAREQLRQLDLGPQVAELGSGSYFQVLQGVQGLARTYLLDSELQELEAWRLYSEAAARMALLEVDPVKDRYMMMAWQQDVELLLPMALECSRRLAAAMFRIESFYIFLLGHTAGEMLMKMQDVPLQLLAEGFKSAMPLYEMGMNALDLLAYSIIPNLEVMLREPQGDMPLNRSSPLNLMAVSLGDWAKTGFLTLWSILQHRSTPLRVFILGDELGLRRWQEAAEELSGHVMLKAVTFEYIDFERRPAFQAYLERQGIQLWLLSTS